MIAMAAGTWTGAWALSVTNASAAPQLDWEAQLHPEDLNQLLNGLQLDIRPRPVRAQQNPDKRKSSTLAVAISGEYERQNWSLAVIGRNTSTGGRKLKKEFKTEIQLTGPITLIDIIAVGPKGQAENMSLRVLFPDYEKALDVLKNPALIPTSKPASQVPSQPTESPSTPAPTVSRRSLFTFGTGITFYDYKDSRTDDTASSAITAKASMLYVLKPKLVDLALNSYITVLPISTVGPNELRFLGFNARVGYNFQKIPTPWRLAVMGGFYYTTTLRSSSDGFGFTHMMGPQIYPVVSRSFKNQTSAYGYFKYSPVSGGGFSLNSSSSEVALGGGYSFWAPFPGGLKRLITATLDIARLSLLIEDVSIQSTSTTIGLSYGF